MLYIMNLKRTSYIQSAYSIFDSEKRTQEIRPFIIIFLKKYVKKQMRI